MKCWFILMLPDPASAAALGWIEGLTLGFLVAIAFSIVTGIAAAALLDVLDAGLVSLIGALVVDPLFGATVGLGLWRHAFVAPPTARGSTAQACPVLSTSKIAVARQQ